MLGIRTMVPLMPEHAAHGDIKPIVDALARAHGDTNSRPALSSEEM
jgi:hypothetical protein